MPYPSQTLFQNFFLQNLCTNHTDTPTPYRPRFRQDQRSGSHKFHANPATANQSTNDTVQHTPQPYTRHKFRAHTAPQTHSLHKHTASTDTHRHTRRRPPPTLTTHREAMPYLDVDAQPASSGLTVRPSGRTRRRSLRPISYLRNWAGQAPGSTRQAACRIRPYQTRLNQTGSVHLLAIEQSRHQAGSDWTRLNQAVT